MAVGKDFLKRKSRKIPATIFERLYYALYISGAMLGFFIDEPQPLIREEGSPKPFKLIIEKGSVIKTIPILDAYEQEICNRIVVGYDKNMPQSIEIYEYFKNRGLAKVNIEQAFGKTSINGRRVTPNYLRRLRAYNLICEKHCDLIYVRKLLDVRYADWLPKHKEVREWVNSLTFDEALSNMFKRKGSKKLMASFGAGQGENEGNLDSAVPQTPYTSFI